MGTRDHPLWLTSSGFSPLSPTFLFPSALQGCGVHRGNHSAQGTWMTQESRMHINLVELRAVHLACDAFFPLMLSHHIQVMSDNKITVFYVNKQGGVIYLPFCVEAVSLWNWCLKNHILHLATYILGAQNSLVDNLSRHFSLDHNSGRWTVPSWMKSSCSRENCSGTCSPHRRTRSLTCTAPEQPRAGTPGTMPFCYPRQTTGGMPFLPSDC